jgi:hypothetical protein
MNYKQIGDIGQNCAIGELSKYGLGIAFPLSDNYPFDFIIIARDKLFKAQVKTSSCHMKGSIEFRLTSNNFYSGETFTYSQDEIDVFVLYDIIRHRVYLMSHRDISGGNKGVNIRYEPTVNKQILGIRWASDYELGEKRLKELFGWDCPDFSDQYASVREIKQHDHECLVCHKNFSNGQKNGKYCSTACRSTASRKVERPSKEELEALYAVKSQRAIAIKYGVSDKAIEKWARAYGLK